MADLTYLDLINRVIGRLGRTDLASTAQEHILERIEHYTDEFFYSSEVNDESILTAAGQRLYPLPARWGNVTHAQVLNGVWIPMFRKSHDFINREDNLVGALQSLPFHWCLFGGQLRIFPCGANYRLKLTMNQSPAAPVNPTDVNFWTTDAQTLIIAAACETICQLVINDPVREAKFKQVRVDEELTLGSKSIREMGGVRLKGRL